MSHGAFDAQDDGDRSNIRGVQRRYQQEASKISVVSPPDARAHPWTFDFGPRLTIREGGGVRKHHNQTSNIRQNHWYSTNGGQRSRRSYHNMRNASLEEDAALGTWHTLSHHQL